MKIPRIYSSLESFLTPGKVLVLYGPRQVGKTTLLKDYLATTQYTFKFGTGDDLRVQEIIGSQNVSLLKEYMEGYNLLVLDEAQKIPKVGTGLKILVDHVPGIRIIATGSSSFELAGQIGEPLTGRKRTLTLYPVSQIELAYLHSRYELKEQIEGWLLFGGYPEVVTTSGIADKIRLLEELSYSYLVKDILELDTIKQSKTLLDLLRLVAFQIGCEVSHHELAKQVNLDTKTVARYLDLLEKSFVLFNVHGYSRNLRSEIAKKSKYYFFDNGIRNAIISNFNKISDRNDIGALWENFVFMERLKNRAYTSIYANVFFWRTWEQQEIDIVEERDGMLYGYECKWSLRKTVTAPPQWKRAYPNARFEVITPENYLPFIGLK